MFPLFIQYLQVQGACKNFTFINLFNTRIWKKNMKTGKVRLLHNENHRVILEDMAEIK